MRILKTLTLSLIIIVFSACSSDDQDSPQQQNSIIELEKDRDALIEIYNANTNNTLTWDITSIDISTWDGITVENNRVTVLNIGDKAIETIPATALEQLTALRNLTANDNALTIVNLSYSVNLKTLQLFNNQLDVINLSPNVLLEQVLLENNNIEDLDVSMLSSLTDLKAGSNSFTNSVNIANGNNSNMWRMIIGSNNLSCVQVDSGATNGFDGWSISAGAIYNTVCP